MKHKLCIILLMLTLCAATIIPARAASSVSAYEQAVCDLVNSTRTQYGLAPLTLRADLCAYARIKSEDLRAGGYFQHTSPTYGSPFSMMRSFGISYTVAAENIAMDYSTPAAVVCAWMQSAPHRETILTSSYTQTGVGYVADGGYWTQWFIG